MKYDLNVEILENTYVVHVEIKRMKNLSIRFINNEFFVHTSRFTTKTFIKDCLISSGPKLIEKSNRKKYFNNNSVFVLGEEQILPVITIENKTFTAYSEEQFYEKVKPILLKYVTDKIAYYEGIMGIPIKHSVTVSKLKSIYGSNNFVKNKIHLSTTLIHYSYTIIDSVIVHELSHYFVHNHSKEFYAVVNNYFHDYDFYRKKMKKGEFKWL